MCRTDSEYIERMLEFREEERNDAESEARLQSDLHETS